MSTEGKPSFNPFRWIGNIFKWLIGQFDDGILIGLSILGAGLLVIGGMFLIGHLTPKQSVVNKAHIFKNTYGHNNDYRAYQALHPAQYHQQTIHHGGHLSYPQNAYHRPHHVQSYSHHHNHSGHYSRYNKHMASSHVVAPRSHVQHTDTVMHTSKKSPYAMHRFGKPRGAENYNSKSYHFASPGGAHAAH